MQKHQGRIIHPILPPQQINDPAIKIFNVSIISGHIPEMFYFFGSFLQLTCHRECFVKKHE